jgi:hypothetical protein
MIEAAARTCETCEAWETTDGIRINDKPMGRCGLAGGPYVGQVRLAHMEACGFRREARAQKDMTYWPKPAAWED